MRGQFLAGGRIAGLIRGARLRGYAAGLVAMLVVLLIGAVFIIMSYALRSPAALSASCRRTARGARR